MSTTTDDRPAGVAPRPAGPADTVRQVVVLLTSLLAIGAAFIGSGAVVGTPIIRRGRGTAACRMH